MSQKSVAVFFIMLMASAMLNAADKLPRNFKSSLLSGQLSNRYFGSGFSFLKFNGHFIGSISCTYLDLKNESGKRFHCREKTLCDATDISVSDDNKEISFKTLRPVTDNTGKVYAEVAREWSLKDNVIKVKAKLIVKESLKLAGCWLLRDIFSIKAGTVKGATVECLGLKKDSEVVSAMIPMVYSKEKWNMGGSYSQVKIISKDTELVTSAAKGAGMTICYTGGGTFGLYIKPMIRYHDVNYQKGDEISWSYTIKFTNIK